MRAGKTGKRSAGFSGASIVLLAFFAVFALAAAFFATHFIYTAVTGRDRDEADFTTEPPALQTTLPVVTTENQGGGSPDVTTTRSRPEDLPGVPQTTAPQTTAAQTTAPETTAPETTAPDTTASDTTETETTASDTTEPETTAADTTPDTTAPPTAPPATTQPPTAPPTTAATTSGTTSPIVLNEQGLYSAAALMLDLETGETLFSYNSEKSVYPASLGKMMTALVTIENNTDLDKKVTFTEAMLEGLKDAGASTAGFSVGETVTLNDLLHGLMLPSGADAANAVAIVTSGSISEFVKQMNQKAAALGMKNTNFTNTHGLHNEKQVSTCRDLATLLTYALDNASFRRIFTTPTYTTTKTEQHPNGIKLTNNMSAALEDNPLKRGRVIGNKTGFTTPAGQCLASLAVIGGREYILVTVGAGKSGWNTQRYNMLDAIELYGRIE